ncbi:MAG: hypothetical protein P8N50_12605 [Actinomycetota bacterium]|jgi:hypothetical protein|nr:hypothetical protein [Actinomycetota bacterium]
MSDDTTEPAELGAIATRLLYEDDKVAIWEQRLAPGEATDAHLHENAYILIDVEGDKLRVDPADGYENPHFDESFELYTKPGRALEVPAGSYELAVNTGASAYHGILVELK